MTIERCEDSRGQIGHLGLKDEDLPLMYCASCLAPITAKGWTCQDSCPRKKLWEQIPMSVKVCL